MSASWAKSAAQRAKQADTAEEKLNHLAVAIGYLADAIRDIDQKVDRVKSRVG